MAAQHSTAQHSAVFSHPCTWCTAGASFTAEVPTQGKIPWKPIIYYIITYLLYYPLLLQRSSREFSCAGRSSRWSCRGFSCAGGSCSGGERCRAGIIITIYYYHFIGPWRKCIALHKEKLHCMGPHMSCHTDNQQQQNSGISLSGNNNSDPPLNRHCPHWSTAAVIVPNHAIGTACKQQLSSSTCTWL